MVQDKGTGAGLVHVRSASSVADTVGKLKALLHARGLPLLAQIDHGGDAKRAGLEMRPTELLIFGNARQGTPLMIAAPSAAIDLPLKALIWQDEAGVVWVTYNSPEYLRQRHSIPEPLLANIAGIKAICEQAAGLP